MKVAEISAFLNFSVGNIMKSIQKNLVSAGHECRIFYARGKKSDDMACYRYSCDSRIRINACVARFFDNDGFFDKKSTLVLIKMIKEYDPDIIHIHCLHGYHLNVELLFDCFKGIRSKIIWTMHDVWAMTGHCCYFESFGCKKWMTGCNHCPAIREYPKSLFLDNSAKNFYKKKLIFTGLDKSKMTIVSPSFWMDHLVNDSYLNKYNHFVINNGIPVDDFKDYGLNREKILLAVASVWDRRKNLKYVLNLSLKLKEWKIIIVGKVTDIDKSLYQNVIFRDRTTNKKELIDLYNEALLFINPTIDENFPTVNIEAQLCGLRVLCFNSGGCVETDIGNLEIIGENMHIDDSYLNRAVLRNHKQQIDKTKLSENRMCSNYIRLMYDVLKKENE